MVLTPIFLIDHPEGKVLFETGVHEDVATDPVGHWGEDVVHGKHYVRGLDWKPDVSREQPVERQLAKLGIEPDDIRYVILSVLVPDHAGGMHAFPNATFIVQFQELQDAWDPPTFMPYHYDYNELLPTRDFNYRKLYDQDLDLYGDGSIEVLFCPAHTRGEQALVVRLPNTGTIVMPAGVIPQKANWDRGVITGTPCVDPVVVERSSASSQADSGGGRGPGVVPPRRGRLEDLQDGARLLRLRRALAQSICRSGPRRPMDGSGSQRMALGRKDRAPFSKPRTVSVAANRSGIPSREW